MCTNRKSKKKNAFHTVVLFSIDQPTLLGTENLFVQISKCVPTENKKKNVFHTVVLFSLDQPTLLDSEKGFCLFIILFCFVFVTFRDLVPGSCDPIPHVWFFYFQAGR